MIIFRDHFGDDLGDDLDDDLDDVVRVQKSSRDLIPLFGVWPILLILTILLSPDAGPTVPDQAHHSLVPKKINLRRFKESSVFYLYLRRFEDYYICFSF